ncbi:hypothetical protein BD324DRAFT_634026 [Kockovaella imperatae]|uniref:PCI domain-containing protein n=1 Tax=Kockovaella imperatae TaxID=4999 RepID=A0A1Y1UAU5_9TREE|nr:hypothetical protein BD324DRAFT_634026 [Kockovaella imperatae]ORX35139.1 hypothetical protein BD324DRAFT_634026 [Kockovaella imperatae]
MSDAVAIVPELPFQQQVSEYARHLTRSLPNASDIAAAKEFVAGYESQVKGEEGQEVPESTRQEIVRSLVEKTVELKGALEASKESETESSHLLLNYLLSSTFEPSSSTFNELSRSVIDSLRSGGEAAASSSRPTRLDAACRILNNTYNYLPPTSSLRPHTLTTLLSLLALSSELSALPLHTASLSASLTQWDISSDEKISFLLSAADIYAQAGQLPKALEIQLLALRLKPSSDIAERALALALADQTRFSLDDVLRLEGVKASLNGKMAEVKGLFEGSDEVGAVKQGLEWSSSSSSWIEGLKVPSLTSESIVRKLRLIALTTLAAKSPKQELTYEETAKALQIDEKDVEAWVIEAIRASLIRARLSQPQSLIRITYVSSRGTPAFGPSEWQLLERRLEQWQKVVGDARKVVEDAEGLAAQGPITHRPRTQGPSGQQQREQAGAAGGRREEEVAA